MIETIFWCSVAIPAGVGLGIFLARELFDVDLIEIFKRKRS